MITISTIKCTSHCYKYISNSHNVHWIRQTLVHKYFYRMADHYFVDAVKGTIPHE